METSQPFSRALASPLPAIWVSDTPLMSPHLCWRTGGLQGTLLPPSLVRAALAENGWPSLRSQLSQEGQGQVAPRPKSGPRWELDGSCWRAGAEGWG